MNWTKTNGSEGEALLDRAQEIFEELQEADLVDKIPTEDKILLAHEQNQPGLAPWEIQEIIQEAMINLPDGLEEHVDAIFNVVYEAVSEAVNQARE